MAGLLDNPQNLTMLLSGLGLLTSKTQNQADRWKAYGADGLLQGARDKQKQQQAAATAALKKPQDDAKLALTKAQTNSLINPQRKTAKDANDRLVYTDDGSFVTDDVQPKIDNLFGFKNKKEMLDSQRNVKKDFKGRTDQIANTMDMFQASTDMINRVGGFNKMQGADDTILMKSFAKHVLPKESVMGDDMRIIGSQQGLPEWALTMLTKLQNKGTLTAPERERIYESMKGMNASNFQLYASEMAGSEGHRRETGLPAESIYKQSFPVPYSGSSGLLGQTNRPAEIPPPPWEQ